MRYPKKEALYFSEDLLRQKTIKCTLDEFTAFLIWAAFRQTNASIFFYIPVLVLPSTVW